MKREQLPGYAMVLVVLIVGLAFAGVPLSTLLILPLVLACPLMMFFMMRGMDHGGTTQGHGDEHPGAHGHGAGCGHDNSADQPADIRPTHKASGR